MVTQRTLPNLNFVLWRKKKEWPNQFERCSQVVHLIIGWLSIDFTSFGGRVHRSRHLPGQTQEPDAHLGGCSIGSNSIFHVLAELFHWNCWPAGEEWRAWPADEIGVVGDATEEGAESDQDAGRHDPQLESNQIRNPQQAQDSVAAQIVRGDPLLRSDQTFRILLGRSGWHRQWRPAGPSFLWYDRR